LARHNTKKPCFSQTVAAKAKFGTELIDWAFFFAKNRKCFCFSQEKPAVGSYPLYSHSRSSYQCELALRRRSRGVAFGG